VVAEAAVVVVDELDALGVLLLLQPAARSANAAAAEVAASFTARRGTTSERAGRSPRGLGGVTMYRGR
jgi:hypothetical protein